MEAPLSELLSGGTLAAEKDGDECARYSNGWREMHPHNPGVGASLARRPTRHPQLVEG